VLTRLGKQLKMPKTGIPLCLQAVGYPADLDTRLIRLDGLGSDEDEES
jgi:hypothetical protein